MIDWHSHILPKMDDGSRDVSESVRLLRMQKEQGVDTVIATPHFYAEKESVSHFLARRQESLALLKSEASDDLPELLLGAEVRYYPGIGQMDGLERLLIEKTRILLLEMPFEAWSEYTIREVQRLACTGNLTVALAHVDRYLSFQKSSTWERLYESGVLMQANADFFQGFLKQRRALTMLQNGGIHFLGSDCHNTTSRPPCIGQVLALIGKKFGEEFLRRMDAYGRSFFRP